MGSLQTGFWSSGIPRDYNQRFQQYVLSSHCVPHTRVAHPSLHHSVPQEGDLCTLDQPGHLGSALAGDLRPGGEVSLGIYPLAPTLLVCISTKVCNPSFLQMPGLLPPQQLRAWAGNSPQAPRSHHLLLISLHPAHHSSVVPLKGDSSVRADQYRHVSVFFWTQNSRLQIPAPY